VSAVLASAAPSAYWYLTRSTGAVALVLLTVVVVLGVVEIRRLGSRRWPRFVVDVLHRNAALLAIVFLAVHVLTSALDGFAAISLVDAFVPFAGSYRPLWLGLGAVALDLLVAVTLTSVLRRRIGYRAWRAFHWLSYASWPVALLHGLGTGSDVKSAWLLALSLACLAAVLAAISIRAIAGWSRHRDRARLALVGTGAFALLLSLWLPLGPLGSEWARRSGTPPALLRHGPSLASSDSR
jgi:predicted ferric reductase